MDKDLELLLAKRVWTFFSTHGFTEEVCADRHLVHSLYEAQRQAPTGWLLRVNLILVWRKADPAHKPILWAMVQQVETLTNQGLDAKVWLEFLFQLIGHTYGNWKAAAALAVEQEQIAAAQFGEGEAAEQLQKFIRKQLLKYPLAGKVGMELSDGSFLNCVLGSEPELLSARRLMEERIMNLYGIDPFNMPQEPPDWTPKWQRRPGLQIVP